MKHCREKINRRGPFTSRMHASEGNADKMVKEGLFVNVKEEGKKKGGSKQFPKQ